MAGTRRPRRSAAPLRSRLGCSSQRVAKRALRASGATVPYVDPRISLITLGVADLERSYRFYKTASTPRPDTRGRHRLQTPDTSAVSLRRSSRDVGPDWKRPSLEVLGITLPHNVRQPHEVDDVLAQASAAGGRVVKEAGSTTSGGYAGYFSDPDGYLWEVACGAFDFNEDGSLRIA